MSDTPGATPIEGSTMLAPWRQRISGRLRATIEGGLLILVCLAPWAFGAVDPLYEAALYGGLALLALVWGARLLAEGRLAWRRCPLAVCLAALFLLAAVQLAQLPTGLLRALSPATADLFARLLPEQPEALPAGMAAPLAAAPAGSGLSLYPQGTRRQGVQLLAVLLAFALAANNVPAGPGLRRLAWLALANGALLALLGLLQAMTSAPGTIYWVEKTRGSVFGPFICRNHFAFYVNMCIGLALGLLLGRSGAGGSRRGPRGLLATLQDPQALWIGLALALMITSVIFCLSRGGFLALIAGAAVVLLLRPGHSSRYFNRGAVLLPAAVALGLLAWFGLERVQARLGTLWGDEAFRDDRVLLLPRCLPVARAFPLLGTGFGTFDYVEPTHRTDAWEAGTSYVHAHNDYLEAMVEGGTVRLGLSLLAIGLVYWRGVRACRRYAGRPEGALALGALAAFTTVVVHSALDFGLHIPAIALLATVLCADLSGLGAPARAADPEGVADSFCVRLGGLAPLAGAAVLVVVGLVLSVEGWRAERTHRLEVAAIRLRGRTDAPSLERRIEYLEAAARLDPANARLLGHLGQAYTELLDLRLKGAEDIGWALAEAQAALGSLPGCLSAPPACSAAAVSCAVTQDLGTREVRVERLARHFNHKYRAPALRRYLEARDCCPLMPRPHLWVAIYANGLARGEPRPTYLQRAKGLAPGDPEVWYRCGFLEVSEPDPGPAWESWRRCLELSDRYLSEILARARKRLSPPEILARVLPDRPGPLLKAAAVLYPDPEDDGRRPFLEKAVTLLGRQPMLSAENYYDKAQAHATLGQADAAVAAYRAALDRKPEDAGWRYAYARLLFKLGRYADARREVRTALDLRPQDGPSRELFEEVNRLIAAGK
jgi:tetratricopeptide (TPR) repeat protein/O-antigen ligase